MDNFHSGHEINCEEDLRENNFSVLLTEANLAIINELAQSATLVIVHNEVNEIVILIDLDNFDGIPAQLHALLHFYLPKQLLLGVNILFGNEVLINHLNCIQLVFTESAY
jgi:hypothetical protein